MIYSLGNASKSTFALLIAFLVFMIVTTANAQQSETVSDYAIEQFGEPPLVPTGSFSDEVKQAIQIVFVDSVRGGGWGSEQNQALELLANSNDPRIAWLIADLMRFATGRDLDFQLAMSASHLLGFEYESQNFWGELTDHLIAWKIPAPPSYLDTKRAIFTTIVPGWDKIFVDGDIDWRHVSWGGVLIDDRAYDTTDEPCNCIPAADNPETSSASDAKWLKDDDIIFGIGINGEYRAYPRRIMEVREMVNDTLGGRDLAIPYCTLCGAAQAYFTDQLPEGIDRPVLRTSGLLLRSNKVIYDIPSPSVFDTFRGNAVTGPLAEKGVKLKQAPVVTSTWGAWKAAHPETTVLVEALALGRDFDFRNNRDANGPIFPVGDVDPRLPIHEDVVGVLTASGQPIAFPRSAAFVALKNGNEVVFDDVKLALEADGLRAFDAEGAELASHQAFWFAWSQFYPETELWVN